jgi:hypothetical protein
MDFDETFDRPSMPKDAGYDCHEKAATQESSHTLNRYDLARYAFDLSHGDLLILVAIFGSLSLVPRCST